MLRRPDTCGNVRGGFSRSTGSMGGAGSVERGSVEKGKMGRS